MTFLERFAELKDKFEKVDTGKCQEHFALQVTMTDDDCRGIFYIANQEQGFSVEPYDYRDHTAHLMIQSQDLMDILDGKLDPVKAYLEGEIKVEGNLEHVKLVASLVEKPKRKTPAKKAAAEKKTAAEKKPAAAKKATKSKSSEKSGDKKSKKKKEE